MTLAETHEKLDRLALLLPGWDSYDAEPPTSGAISSAKDLLEWAVNDGLPVPFVGAMAEGGVVLEWLRGEPGSAGIECSNDGERVAVLSDGEGEIDCWVVASDSDSIEHALLSIRRQRERLSSKEVGSKEQHSVR